MRRSIVEPSPRMRRNRTQKRPRMAAKVPTSAKIYRARSATAAEMSRNLYLIARPIRTHCMPSRRQRQSVQRETPNSADTSRSLSNTSIAFSFFDDIAASHEFSEHSLKSRLLQRATDCNEKKS